MRSGLWALGFMLRIKRLSLRTGIPFDALIEAHIELMRLETEELQRQNDHLRMARELITIETDAIKSLPPA